MRTRHVWTAYALSGGLTIEQAAKVLGLAARQIDRPAALPR